MDRTEPYARRWWALGVLCFSLIVIGLDNTILNVALPSLVRDLGAGASELQWMVEAYILVFAGLLLTMGALGDRFGRKRALQVGLLVFLSGSVSSAFAASPQMLIAARGLMGVGGALIMPSTLSIITNIFPPRERGRAIALWAAFAGLGIVVGPVVGGWLLERFWWGSVFLINVPVIAFALAAGQVLVPESKDPAATPLDPVGALLSIAGLVALVYGIIEAPAHGWTSGSTLGALGLGLALMAVFTAWERRSAHPMLRMEFFRNPRFSAASIAVMLVFFALFGTVFLLTQYLQFVLGLTPLEAGIRLMTVSTMIVFAPLSARLVERLGTKAVVTAGLVLVAGSLWVIAGTSPADTFVRIGIATAMLGAGMGTTMAPATESIMGSLPLGKAGVGSAMNDTTRQVGGALGVAVLGSVLSSAYASEIGPALAGLPAQAASAAADSIGATLRVAQQLGPAGGPVAEAARAAFVHAMSPPVMIASAVALLGAVVALVFLPSRAPARDQGGAARLEPVEERA
ncbi:MAG: DHA2 family efflux MFS transporter permease subunit [Actinomycetota bacterium]